MELMLRDELRVALRLRGHFVSGLKKDLVERLLHERGARGLTEEAALALQMVMRRSGSRPDGRALLDDAGAYAWIRRACTEGPRGQEGQGADAGVRRRAPG